MWHTFIAVRSRAVELRTARPGRCERVPLAVRLDLREWGYVASAVAFLVLTGSILPSMATA
jgi:hypothetical protein